MALLSDINMPLVPTPTKRFVYGAVVFISALWVPLARGQCNSGTSFQAICAGLSGDSLLGGDIPSTFQVTVRCSLTNTQNTGPLLGWTRSPDGGEFTAAPLNTTASKYTVGTNEGSGFSSLTITNINETDEGLYRCDYQNADIRIRCIFVYGRAVFASCFQSGCNGDSSTQLSIEDGGSVDFEARVAFTHGGSCGLRQMIERVKLEKINPQFGVRDEEILSCAISESRATTCSTNRASLDRGNEPGYEFVFTLNDVSHERDAGLYRVTVTVRHPRTNTPDEITKEFSLEVLPPTTTTSALVKTTPTDVTEGHSTSTAITEPTDTVLLPGRSSASQTAIIASLVPIVVVLLGIGITAGVLLLVVRQRRGSKTSDDLVEEEKVSERNIITQEVGSDGGNVEGVLPLHSAPEELPPNNYEICGPREKTKKDDENTLATERLVYNKRNSLIESNVHLPADGNLNSRAAHVIICETGQETTATV